jgi:hypothetical protein
LFPFPALSRLLLQLLPLGLQLQLYTIVLHQPETIIKIDCKTSNLRIFAKITDREQKFMKKSHLFLATLTSIFMVIGISGKALLQPLPPLPPQPQQSTQPNQKPSQKPSLPSGQVALPDPDALLDIVSNFVIKKYQSSSCEELAKMKPQSNKSASAAGTPEAVLQAKAVEMLRKNPEMRKKFINRVAGPIANKMFECKAIP